MEINLIILSKQKESIQLGMKKQIKNLLEVLFSDVSDDRFVIEIGTETNYIDYKISAKSKNMLFLKLSCDETPTKAAKILDSAINKLIQGEHRKMWNIVISYDEVSQLYCCKLMPLFGIFERRTRELVYITIIKIFGVEWFDQSFSKNLKDTLKGKGNKTKLVEKALDELTYEQLKEYLFLPYCNREFTEVLEQEFSEIDIKNLTREEMIKVIDECRSKSLWNRFFSEYKQFDDFEAKIDGLQQYRNVVMHNKRITLNEYNDVRRKLKSVNKLLIQAIDVLEDEIYSDTNLIDVIGAFGNLLVSVLGKSIPKWIEKMKPALSSLGEIVIKSAIPQTPMIDMMPSLNVISQSLLDVGRNYECLHASTAAQLELASKAYQSTMLNIPCLNQVNHSLNVAGTQLAANLAMPQNNTFLIPDAGITKHLDSVVNSPAIVMAREIAEQNQRIANMVTPLSVGKYIGGNGMENDDENDMADGDIKNDET